MFVYEHILPVLHPCLWYVYPSTQKQIMFVCIVSIISFGWMCEQLSAVNCQKESTEPIYVCDA